MKHNLLQRHLYYTSPCDYRKFCKQIRLYNSLIVNVQPVLFRICMHVFVFYTHFLRYRFLSHTCCITCRVSLALSCILLVCFYLNGSLLIRHFSEFKCTKAERCPWHIFCSLAGFQRFLMCGLARWVH